MPLLEPLGHAAKNATCGPNKYMIFCPSILVLLAELFVQHPHGCCSSPARHANTGTES